MFFIVHVVNCFSIPSVRLFAVREHQQSFCICNSYDVFAQELKIIGFLF